MRHGGERDIPPVRRTARQATQTTQFTMNPSRSLVAFACLALVLPGCRLLDRNAEEEVPVVELVEREEERLEVPAELPEGEAEADAPSIEVGSDFWAGEGTIGYELSARFPSREALALLLDRSQPLRGGAGTGTLGDILVSVDYRGGPLRASWRVVGPPELVEGYVAGLRDTPGERSPLQELGILRLRVVPWGGDGAAPVIPEES